MEDLTIGFILGIVFLYFAIFALCIANYVITSLSLHTIAGNRNIKNPWLAWLPIGICWIIGSIADEYDARNGIKRKWRIVLLVLSLISVAMYIFLFTYMIILFVTTLENRNFETLGMADALGLFVPVYTFYFITIMAVMVFVSLNCICSFKIFEATVPDKAVLYTILGMTVPLARPICLFVSRNKYSPYTKFPYFPPVEPLKQESINTENISDTQIY